MSTLLPEKLLRRGLRSPAGLREDGRCPALALTEHVCVLLGLGSGVFDHRRRRSRLRLRAHESHGRARVEGARTVPPTGGNGFPLVEHGVVLSADLAPGLEVRWPLQVLRPTQPQDEVLPGLGYVRVHVLVWLVVVALGPSHSDTL